MTNEIKLFSGIKSDELNGMLQCLGCTEKEYSKNAVIAMENENVKKIGIILSGSVHMIKEDIWGNRTILAVMKKNDIIGETFACGSCSELTVSFTAAQKTRLLVLPFKRIITTCSNSCVFHHKLTENMVTMIADKNQQLMEKIEIVSKKTIREKVMTYLSVQSQKAGSLYFEIPLGRVDLADYLCTDRSALTRELNAMKSEGIIDFEKNTFKIK